MPFPTYLSYAENTHDEMPLYVFDKAFASNASSLGKDYSVPKVSVLYITRGRITCSSTRASRHFRHCGCLIVDSSHV